MKTFAQIQDNRLHWRFESAEIPEFSPELEIVNISGFEPMPEEGWLFSDNTFSPPPPPSIDEILARVQGQLVVERKRADDAIAPLQDAVDLEDATEEEAAQLRSWKKFRIALNRMQDQPGFPQNVEWPVIPD